ncbi:MAG: peptide chain release factor N(5)-glutamine methyltransferase [Leptolyngbya sp. SIO4C1]|nr:peptide chain release factor N(5)-glutamine methyltransferase [Leptolyngbya sp. SIO4C1]
MSLEHRADREPKGTPSPPSPSSSSLPGQSLHTWRTWAITQAEAANLPVSEVDWLLQAVTTLDSLALRLETYRDRKQILSRYSLAELTAKWQQRTQAQVPVQYLVGETQWRQFTLTVTPAVLIPRPETELMVDIVQAQLQQSPELASGVWVDLGTGCGAIALGLADLLPAATVLATDISEAAIAIARANAQRNQLAHRIQFHQGSWFEPLSVFRGQLAGVVSNPPYIPRNLLPQLQPEVQHEPQLALDGGADGLDSIRQLIAQARLYLRPQGLWLAELMAGQAQPVAQLLSASQYFDVQIHSDLAGVERFVSARCKNP